MTESNLSVGDFPVYESDVRRATMLGELRWKKFPVLDDGFVCLVDVMGDDAAVVQAARVSYGQDKRDGEQQDSPRNLIRYLMRHRHSTPFEMAEIKLLVRVPMDTWRQWIRHRTANVNEYSTRYTEAIDSTQKTPPSEWRLQSGTNKQGSDGFLPIGSTVPNYGNGIGSDIFNKESGHYLSCRETELQKTSREVYEERLKAGVAREQARKDLPLSTYTEAYWKIDLHNMLHFLGLRMDSHAQKEIRDYATIIGDNIIKPLFPIVWEAFTDYRLGALTLTRLDVLMIARITNNSLSNRLQAFESQCSYEDYEFAKNGWNSEKSRERNECLAKLERLGLL